MSHALTPSSLTSPSSSYLPHIHEYIASMKVKYVSRIWIPESLCQSNTTVICQIVFSLPVASHSIRLVLCVSLGFLFWLNWLVSFKVIVVLGLLLLKLISYISMVDRIDVSQRYRYPNPCSWQICYLTWWKGCCRFNQIKGLEMGKLSCVIHWAQCNQEPLKEGGGRMSVREGMWQWKCNCAKWV